MTFNEAFDPFETDPSQVRPDDSSQRIGNYDLVRILGKGGWAKFTLLGILDLLGDYTP